MFYKEQMHEERAKGALNAVCRTQSKFYKEQTHEERAKRALNAVCRTQSMFYKLAIPYTNREFRR